MYTEGKPVAYLLCYTLMTTKFNKEILTENFIAFDDYDEMEQSPEQQAQEKLNDIMASLDNDETDTILYCWHICKIVKTSTPEIYQADEPCTVMAAWEHSKSELAEEDRLADSEYDEIQFSSRSEAQAFLKGVDNGTGWDAPYLKIKE